MKKTSEIVTKTVSETSINNNKALEKLNEKVLELTSEKGMIAPYLASSLVNLFKLENESQFRLRKDLISFKMNDFLIHGGIPVTIYSNLITLLEVMTNYKINADHSSPQDRKLFGEIVRETNYDIRSTGQSSIRHSSYFRILNSPAIMAFGISRAIVLPSDPNELCDRLNILLQEKHPGNNSDLFNQKIVTIVDKLLKNKSTSKKQHRQFLIECNIVWIITMFFYLISVYTMWRIWR